MLLPKGFLWCTNKYCANETSLLLCMFSELSSETPFINHLQGVDPNVSFCIWLIHSTSRHLVPLLVIFKYVMQDLNTYPVDMPCERRINLSFKECQTMILRTSHSTLTTLFWLNFVIMGIDFIFFNSLEKTCDTRTNYICSGCWFVTWEMYAHETDFSLNTELWTHKYSSKACSSAWVVMKKLGFGW